MRPNNTYLESLFTLIRLGIGNSAGFFLETYDWVKIQTLANAQGVNAVVLDGTERLPELQRPPKVFLLEWIGETLQRYEYRYEQYRQAIAELAGFYNSRDFKMMVLKGYACGIDWPRPEHRPCGDIDIWLFGQQKKADSVLAKEKRVKIDSSHHHHTVFYWHDFMVENHYDFVNTHDYKSSKDLEVVFKELGKDDSFTTEVYGEKIYLPSPNLHALFLIRHLTAHFASTSVTLRQVLDWAFFVEKHTKEIDWKWLNGTIEKFRMKDFINCINAICVEDLGFDSYIFYNIQFSPSLKDRILRDIIEPEFGIEEPRHLIPRLSFKYKRWRSNAWKRALCYEESGMEAFWSNFKAHILKPLSI